MIKQIVVEWSYKPKDYFERNFTIKHESCEIEISPGIAIARISPIHTENINQIMNDLTHDLESRFLAIQVMTHQPYNLSQPSRYDLNEDGTRTIYVVAKDNVIISDTPPIDIIVSDADGNIISDTKQERIDKKNWFAEASAKYRAKDQTLDQMLKSYSSSVIDPDNELVHLYEIRDAVSKKFGNDNKANSKLNITNKDWSDFGLIANKKPLLQGRHRGNNVGILRKADSSELETVRKIASKIIESYMIYLEKEDPLISR
jgi:hypothetical protein